MKNTIQDKVIAKNVKLRAQNCFKSGFNIQKGREIHYEPFTKPSP
ncbi:hypothetical protein CSC18_4446 [Klebsiella aerogenes]|nr:hypothetical protein CSC18_4446 [Klebsiella aerogenes]